MRISAALLLLLAACTSPAPQILQAMAPAPPPECDVEWPADHTAAPILVCTDGSRQTMRPGTAVIVGNPALAEALP
jgi:hypothetical protein